LPPFVYGENTLWQTSVFLFILTIQLSKALTLQAKVCAGDKMNHEQQS
jgi:hypothetical protein